jgi:hypothetical protein
MSIAARCGDCQKLYKVDDKLAGKRVRCKACGGVVEVPAQSETRAAPASARAPAGPPRAPAASNRSPAGTPSRKPAARPAPPPPQEDDPFSNLDALMSLEGSGTVTDDPPPVRTPKPARTTAAPSGDGILAPAAYSPSLKVRAPGESPARFRSGPINAYISIAGEDTIDGLVPMASIGILIIFLVITFIRTMSAAGHAAPEEVQAQAKGFAFGLLLGAYAILLLVIFGIFSPLCMLGVFIASKIMNFERPGSFYLRCAAVICAPISLGIVVNGFGFGEPTALSWVVMLPVMLGVLWLMFRLKPIPYLVSAAFSMICAVGIPVMLILLLALSLGGLGVFNALGNARNTAVQVKSASHLKQIGMAIMLYANEHRGVYPRSLEELTSVEGFDRASLTSPLGTQPYVYNYFARLNSSMTESYLLAYDPNIPPSGVTQALFMDGHVEQLTSAQFEQAKQLNEQIRRQRSGAGGSIISPGPVRVPAQPRVNQPVDFAAHHARVEASFQKIAGAIKSHAASHRGYYPASFLELRNSGLANSDFYSPFGLPYVYVSPWGAKPPLPGKMVLVFEEGVRDKRRTVLWGDLRVETIGTENWDQILSESTRLRSQLPH